MNCLINGPAWMINRDWPRWRDTITNILSIVVENVDLTAVAAECVPPSPPTRQVHSYIRLLGDKKAVDDLTAKVEHIVIDRSKQIADDAKVIKQLSRSVPVIVAVNNHFAGYSPETIRELMEALKAIA